MVVTEEHIIAILGRSEAYLLRVLFNNDQYLILQRKMQGILKKTNSRLRSCGGNI